MKKFIPGICLFLIQVGLSMGGYQNIYISIGLLSVAGILVAWALFSTLRSVWKEVSNLSEAKKTLGFIIVTLLIMSSVLTSIMAHKISQWKSPEQNQNILNEALKPEKIKATVEQWLFKFRIPFSPGEDVANFDFQLKVNLPGDDILYVGKTRQNQQYLTIQSLLKIIEPQKLQKTLQKKQLNQITRNLRIEIDRLHLEYSDVDMPQRIKLERRLPITNNLTEDVFISAIGEMMSAVDLIKQTLQKELERIDGD